MGDYRQVLDCRLDLLTILTRIVATLNRSAICDLHNLQLTTGRLKSFLSASVFTSHSLVIDQVFFSKVPLQLTKL
jgi:hypothetical protein